MVLISQKDTFSIGQVTKYMCTLTLSGESLVLLTGPKSTSLKKDCIYIRVVGNALMMNGVYIVSMRGSVSVWSQISNNKRHLSKL